MDYLCYVYNTVNASINYNKIFLVKTVIILYGCRDPWDNDVNNKDRSEFFA